MGTRGLYGIRKDKRDYLTYNHYDSYPSVLGLQWLRFAHTALVASKFTLDDFVSRIVLVKEEDTPNKEQIALCRKLELSDLSVSERNENDWYCLLRNLQGNTDKYIELMAHPDVPIFMIDNHEFIRDSMYCEHAYIINLDTDMFEYWRGFQKEPDKDNRYGTKGDRYGYYPCKLKTEIPLDLIASLHRADLEELANHMANQDYINEMYLRFEPENDETARKLEEICGKLKTSRKC